VQVAREFAQAHRLNALLWNHASVLHGAEHKGVVLAPAEGCIQEIVVESKQDIARCLVELFIKSEKFV
jgi:hypothetical protein